MVSAKGGTEILVESFYKNIDIELLRGFNVIVNNTNPQQISNSAINILWMHHNYDQPAVTGLNHEYLKNLDMIVFVSHWQHAQFRDNINLEFNNVKVIKNAIENVEYKTKKSEKLKIVYTSTPWRGLDILLDAFETLDPDNAELHIFTSTIIYGHDFFEKNDHIYVPLYNKAKAMKNVVFHGYKPNVEVKDFIASSHIMAYPSCWQETSCISVIEAAAAGCRVLTTNLGALPETLSDYGVFVEFNKDRNLLIKNYAKALNREIQNYWNETTQNLLKEQVIHFRNHWNWSKRIIEWTDLLKELKAKYVD